MGIEVPIPSASFRFVDLPAEIRMQIYRKILLKYGQHVTIPMFNLPSSSSPNRKDLAIMFVSRLIYSEAMPLFLFENHFIISGTRREHTWLRRMRPEGRSELRNVTFQVPPKWFSLGYSFYNALSLCTQVHLTLEISRGFLSDWVLENKTSLRNMHGFAAATSNTLPKETDLCERHQHNWATSWDVTSRQELMQRVESLLQQFRAPCIGKCRVHKGREGTHTQSTIHLDFRYGNCYYCC